MKKLKCLAAALFCALLLSACLPAPVQARAATPAPTATPTPAPTATPTPAPTATPTPAPTATPTPAPTLQPGVWHTLAPEGAVSADGSAWYGLYRPGTENRVLVYFLGGGVSFDDHSAARSGVTAGADGFYYSRDDGLSERRAAHGIAGDHPDNPFRNWTVILVPYTTADFHIGAGAVEYTALDGSTATLNHHGYRNYTALMQLAAPLAGEPEALMITGYSAGGFGAALLAGDVMGYFPETRNVTLCVDSALLINENWGRIARERWHAPRHVLENISGGNLTLDALCALERETEGRVKILFTCSLRDGGLARYQSYIDGGPYSAGEAQGDVQQQNLRVFVRLLRARLPRAGIFIWDGDDFGGTDAAGLTRHTILSNDGVFTPLRDGKSIADWMMDAVNGETGKYGLALFGAAPE